MEVRIVERIKIIKGDDVVDPVPLIILTVFFLITIAIIIVICFWCIRRERHRHAQKKEIAPAPWS